MQPAIVTWKEIAELPLAIATLATAGSALLQARLARQQADAALQKAQSSSAQLRAQHISLHFSSIDQINPRFKDIKRGLPIQRTIVPPVANGDEDPSAIRGVMALHQLNRFYRAYLFRNDLGYGFEIFKVWVRGAPLPWIYEDRYSRHAFEHVAAAKDLHEFEHSELLDSIRNEYEAQTGVPADGSTA